MLTNEQLLAAYNNFLARVEHIKELFISQFGEDKVDLQYPRHCTFEGFKSWYNSCFDYSSSDPALDGFFEGLEFKFFVYWPEVKITNEENMSHIIKDLYAKVSIDLVGKLLLGHGFELNRTTYTDAEWVSTYLHSHIPGINTSRPSEFLMPCLGRGPINAAVYNLKREYDEDWFTEFLFELDRYVYVESIAGVPYRKMRNITLTSSESRYALHINPSSFCPIAIETEYLPVIHDFLQHLFSNNAIAFNNNGNKFLLGKSYNEEWLNISNAFIEWYNTQTVYAFTLVDLLQQNILVHVVHRDNNFYPICNTSITAPVGSKILTFKGEHKNLTIITTAIPERQENSSYILSANVVSNILSLVTYYVNYCYGNH